MSGNNKSIMKRIFYYLLGTIFICVSFMSGCKNRQTEDLVKPPVISSLNTGEELSSAIDYITADASHWSQGLFDSISNKISSLAAAGTLNKNLREDKSLKERLFDASALLLKNHVDSVFRLSSYGGYRQMKRDLKFLQETNAFFYDVGLMVDKTNQNLKEVEEIFENYEKVLNLSRRRFRKHAVYMENYSLDYKWTKSQIEDNKYYSVYFCNNNEITKGVNEFEKRVKEARYDYLSELVDTIKCVALRDSLSYEQLFNDQSKFYEYANGVNQPAIDSLAEFVRKYEEPTREEQANFNETE